MSNESDVLKEISKKISELEGKNDLGGLSNAFYTHVIQPLAGYVQPFSKIQSAAFQLAKSVGMTAKGIMNTSTRIISINRDLQISKNYGISSDELIGLQGDIMSKVARNVTIDATGLDSTMDNIAAATKIFEKDTVTDLIAGYDKIGKSMKSAAKVTGKLMDEAGEYGINLQKYTENFTSNLQLAQTYNFRNGVNGLREMARKATEVRQDMKQVATFADKVGTVTGAVETAANLQVLGGSFAAMADPLAMLNESLTDINGLQDRMLSMTANAAHYDEERHQMVMNPFERMRLKQAAIAMGVDPNSLIDTAFAQGRKKEFEKRMEGMGLSEDFKKVIANAGQINEETGQAGITIGDKFYGLNDIGQMDADAQKDLYKELMVETRPEKDDIKDIAKHTQDIATRVRSIFGQLENEAAYNTTIPGVFGDTTVDIVTDALESFQKEGVEGLGRIDMALSETFKQVGAGFKKALVGVTPVATSFGRPEFGENFDEAWKNIAGTGETAQDLGGFLKEYILMPISDLSSNIAGELRKIGIELDPRTRADEEGYYKWDSSERRPTARNEDAAIAQVREMFSQTKELHLESTDLAQVKANIVNVEGFNPQGVQIRETNETMQGYQVEPPRSQDKQEGVQNNTQGPINGELNLNISGNLMMNVTGTDGKTGTVDLIKMIENNPQFQRELATMLTEAMKEKGFTITNK